MHAVTYASVCSVAFVANRSILSEICHLITQSADGARDLTATRSQPRPSDKSPQFYGENCLNM